MGDLAFQSNSRSGARHFFLRTVLILATWVVGATFASRVPDDAVQRRAEELLAPAPAPAEHPPQKAQPNANPDSRPAEAPPLIDPPSPAPV